jgi:acetylornithine/succinyldiaminopimelate/putrescine aminotransferase
MSILSPSTMADLAKITTRTAGIVLETIQGGAGFIQPHNDFLKSS